VELLKNKDGEFVKVEETSLFNPPPTPNREENLEGAIDTTVKEA